MGLSASQYRYLSLTARKSDLEYQSQMINNARLALSDKTAAAAKAYSEGMSNQLIRIASSATDESGQSKQVWNELTYTNLLEQGYNLIGTNGESLYPSPYTEYPAGSVLTSQQYENLPTSERIKCAVNDDGTYTVKEGYLVRTEDTSFKGMDIQTLLVSGQGHIVSGTFFNYLCEHGYGTGSYFDYDEQGQKYETTYANLLDKYKAGEYAGTSTVIDWRSDTTSTFKQNNYTEDDAQVSADYEAKTAEIQREDKQLELQLKSIETEHKAIETEMESVQKVIQKNIENSYKTFGNA